MRKSSGQREVGGSHERVNPLSIVECGCNYR